MHGLPVISWNIVMAVCILKRRGIIYYWVSRKDYHHEIG